LVTSTPDPIKTKAPQFELPACSDAFNLTGERGVDGARVIAEMAAAMRAEREAKKLAEKMQTKLALCPGFVGCHPGGITAQPGAIDEAIEFLKRRFYVGQPQWKRGIGMTIPVMNRAKGLTRAAARRRTCASRAIPIQPRIQRQPRLNVLPHYVGRISRAAACHCGGAIAKGRRLHRLQRRCVGKLSRVFARSHKARV